MSKQDQGAPEPRLRLRLLLALMRALAGARGFSALSWHAGGFRYDLAVTRDPLAPDALELDADPWALNRAALEGQVRQALEPQP